MKIGVLGAGRMTEALAGRWIEAGHEVFIGGRTPEKAADLAKSLGAAGAGTLREAAAYGDVILLAVLREGLESTLAAAGAGEGTLAGKTVVDVGNSVDTEDWSQVTWEGRSMAERAAELAPGSHVVKAFNLAFSDVWKTPPVYGGRPLAVPFAGAAEGKSVTRKLIQEVGAAPLDAGDLSQTPHLEAMGCVVIRQLFGGAHLGSTFAFLTPDDA
ncbi:NAD(P)-binding domain-containing protein [Streptomyces sp. TRM66268-LWL]|uniref:NAD(P)-binding domain-containing protein n=1 Tax=Streptomyces polyasparticus TaxID=2767826 RepID=A0ABR7SWE7_9ACTN|nr:NAD(P)-binding domain-containing protein [Streptomyces polyasparticus]MBC9718975.1 NAD(P)-binding domain-containing protein [Streptomyces polyasparticus]